MKWHLFNFCAGCKSPDEIKRFMIYSENLPKALQEIKELLNVEDTPMFITASTSIRFSDSYKKVEIVKDKLYLIERIK